MKGKLLKDHEGWWVQHKVEGLDGIEYIAESMLHPDNVERMLPDDEKFVKENCPDVEFEMVTEVVASIGDLDTQDYYSISYAKLIPSKEQQKQLITEIMEEDAKDGLYDTVNDTVKELIEQGKQLEAKAKQTLYTEEQVREAMSMARKLSGVAYTNDEIIQSLKQPKK